MVDACFASRYGALALDFPFEATNAAAAVVVALPPLAVAGTLLANSPDLLKPKALGGDNSEDGEGEVKRAEVGGGVDFFFRSRARSLQTAVCA